jgi:hypothetical protein
MYCCSGLLVIDWVIAESVADAILILMDTYGSTDLGEFQVEPIKGGSSLALYDELANVPPQAIEVEKGKYAALVAHWVSHSGRCHLASTEW